MNRDEFETLGIYVLTFLLCMAAAGLIGYFIRMQTEPLTCAEQEAIRKKEFAANVYRLNDQWCAKNQRACRLFVMGGK